MLTVIIKRNAEPTVIQMTQSNIMKELNMINNSEMLLEDRWVDGLKKVRTPYVCLVEADCILSSSYISSNVGLMRKTTISPKGGGYNKLAMISSCVGVNDFANRIYSYDLQKIKDKNLRYLAIQPNRNKRNMKLYHIQVGFVPGAIIRMPAIKRDIENIDWDEKDLVKMSTNVSFHFWGTGRRVQVNPNTTYVSTLEYLDDPPIFNPQVPDKAYNLFLREAI